MHSEQLEFTASEVVGLLQPIVGHDGTLTEARLNHYKTVGYCVPRGRTLFRRRPRYTFADVVALAFLLDMKHYGIPMHLLKDAVDEIQAMTKIPRSLRTSGEIERLIWYYRTGDLAAKIRKAVEEKRRRAA